MKNNKKKGDLGEKLASKYIVKEGYNIIGQNYSTRLGEIDIIARKDDIVAFIEVKARSSVDYGFPYEAVGRTKQRKITNVAKTYLKQYDLIDVQPRFDIIEVYLKSGEINHIENAF